MNTKKLNLAVIYGGTNTEHEVSIVSARSVIQNLDPQKYNVLPIIISKNNEWLAPKQFLSESQTAKLTDGKETLNQIQPEEMAVHQGIDVIFPVLHGPYGEDGTIQGLLEMLHLPYVGCGVLASAICMDKVIQKQLCEKAGIQVAKYYSFQKYEWDRDEKQIIKKIEAKIGYPCFIKPVNQGSSVGVSKADTAGELEEAVRHALLYDHKILAEKAVPNAREIECSVMGHHHIEASVLGEIVPSNEFYDYDAKYIDGQSQAYIPAKVSTELSDRIRQTAIKAFEVVNGSGLARVDFLLDDKRQVFYLNELNTIPGFTTISMYPKLWEATGISYQELLNRLIEIAVVRHKEKQQINLNYIPKTNWHEE